MPKVYRAELSVGEVAARSGLPVSTIHFYEAEGLIRSRRTEGNQRRYERDVLRRVAIIRVAQKVGVPLARIKQALAALPSERTPTPADWAAMSTEWREDLSTRVAQLEALRDQLDACIGCGCLTIANCRLRNPDDKLGDRGVGPLLLER